MSPHLVLGKLHQPGAVAVDGAPHPPKGDVVVVGQGGEGGVDLGVAQAVAAAQGVGGGQVGAAAGGVEDEVGGDFGVLDRGERLARVEDAQEVEDGRVVGLWVLDEDGEADVEEVDLDGEVVGAVGGYDAFAEFAEGGEDLGDRFGCWVCWWL